MDETGAYLRGKYLEDKSEIETVTKTLRDVVQVFGEFFDPGKNVWPYDLKDGDAIALPTSYSYSTNAMIIFALEVLSGRLVGSTLLPGVKQSRLNISGDGGQLAAASNGAFSELKTKVEANLTKLSAFLTESGSFGRDDPFTLTWLAELARHFSSNTAAYKTFRDRVWKHARKHAARAQAAIRKGLPILEGWPSGDREPLVHSFPLLRLLHLLKLLDAEPKEIENTADVLKKRMHLQLSYASIANSGFDAAELVFCMDGILLENRDALDAGTLQRAFEVIRDSQSRNPYWRPLRPFVATSQGFGLLPLSVEIANSLLRICDTLDTPLSGSSYFSINLELFRKYSQWLVSRVTAGKAAGGKQFRGWPSEHVHDPGKIHLWETSQVALFLFHYATMLQRHVARESLAAVNLRATNPNAPAWSEWEKNEPVNGVTKFEVYRRIREEFIKPRQSGNPSSRFVSMLLYGPPGTGKTSAGEALARELNYSFIGVSPSDFITRGEAEVEPRAKMIFEALGEQSDVVVLFDEIDRLILDRDSLLYQKQGDIFQFMTPGMLTKIKKLRDEYRGGKNSIFLIGTNYADRIDPAIKRRGRIDQLYLVGPPDKAQRKTILERLIKKRASAALGAADLESLAGETVFTTYGELEQIVDEGAAGAKTADLPTRLRNAIPRPSISLASYKSRFRATWENQNEAFPTVQEPYDEFFLLTQLLIESGRAPSHEERRLVSTICKYLCGLARGAPSDWDRVERPLQVRLEEYLDTGFIKVLLPGLKSLYKPA